MVRKSNEQKKKEKQAERSEKWKRENTTRLCLRFSNSKDSDVLEKLNSVTSKKAYIADLIRKDMRQEK